MNNVQPTNIESKIFSGHVVQVKQEERNGIQVGIVEGYIATWDLDRGDGFVRDQFARGAFRKSIRDLKSRDRQLRFKDHHGRTIGGFPSETLKEDVVGLFGRGEINLEVQQGREAYMLAKQGVLTDFSVGFTSVKDTETERIRTITEAIVWEGSIVDEPMNPEANITDVKTVKAAVPFQDLPLAPESREWDAAAAEKRMRGDLDSPDANYRKGFLWFDAENADEWGAYKLPIADVIDGQLKAVPRGIFAAAGAMRGARGGVDIPQADRSAVISSLNKYYAKMDLESPFETGDKAMDSVKESEVKEMTKRDLEEALRGGRGFTKEAARTVASLFDGNSIHRDEDKDDHDDEDDDKKKDDDDEKQKADDDETDQEKTDLENLNKQLKECFLKSA